MNQLNLGFKTWLISLVFLQFLASEKDFAIRDILDFVIDILSQRI
jgi:hypothetical protein